MNIEEKKDTHEITIFPNPTSNKITIESAQYKTITTIKILNIRGQELINQQIKEGEKEIDISKLTPGIYFVKCYSDKSVEVIKVVKD